MGGVAVEDFSAFHQRLGEGRVRVDAEGKNLRGRTQLGSKGFTGLLRGEPYRILLP